MFIENINYATQQQDIPTAEITKPKREPLWVAYKELCTRPVTLTYDNARQIKKRGKHKRGGIHFKGATVDINSFTTYERHTWKIPVDNEAVLAHIAKVKSDAIRQREERNMRRVSEDKISEVWGCMLVAKKESPIYYNKIKELHTLSNERCREFAERWAVWVWILENYTRFSCCLETFHAAYTMLFSKHFPGINGKISFKNFLNSAKAKGIENTIIDKRAVVKVKDRRSIFQMTLLQSLYIQDRKIIIAAAYKKLVAACAEKGEKPMCYRNVNNIFGEFKNNSELYKARYGETAAQKQMPYASLLPAEHRNTQWQIDGWTLPFWGNKFQRYVLYLIRDNHSRKIIGWGMAESENTTLILEALEDAMRNTGVFPGELVSDKHSFHRTEIAARLRVETEKMGAVWTVTINAQRNQLAERYNQYLDALCKDFEGYLGKNITATSKDARPSPEILAKYAKTANFKVAEEIKTIAAYVVKEFNNMKLDPLDGLTPNEKYAQSESKKAFALSETERIKLLRPMAAYKVIRGQITIKIGVKKYEFQLPAELISRYNNRQVVAVWEDLTQGIYISDIQSGDELGCIPPKYKIHGAIPDQTDQDRQRINKLTGRSNGVTNKARKKASERLMEGLADHPEAIALINHHSIPKDIRQIAAQDNELKRAIAEQGINPSLMPIRTQTAKELPAMPTKQGKTNESPFNNPNNKLGMATLEDFFGEQ